ncbi:MAG: pantoate--beta-alanine ligase [Bacteroidota bacterium]|nr:pantoate--beta-alanine ligase [Bacteroidota bacterium]
MKIIKQKKELRSEIEVLKASGKTIGFVPTMGALHNGHKSLVERAVAENDICVVSVFVNPTQFNNPTDLEKYPRNLKRDAEFLEKIGCRIIFSPEPPEIYLPDELDSRFEFDFGGLDTVMEGKFRPGHFNGVVQIVSKLFQLVQPDKAYFGEKDFQQLAIIHRMVAVMNLQVEIVDCPIVREASGLALSSRNERLNEDERKKAVEISKVLSESRNFAPQLSPIELTQWVVEQINSRPGLEVEYYEIVNTSTLQPVYSWSAASVGCIAVYCGEVRLIDNIRYKTIEN